MSSTCGIVSTVTAAMTFGVAEDLSHTCYSLIPGSGDIGNLFIDSEAGIVDVNGNHTFTNGGYVSTTNTDPIFGTSSMLFSPTSENPSHAWLRTNSNVVINGQFTIDFWTDDISPSPWRLESQIPFNFNIGSKHTLYMITSYDPNDSGLCYLYWQNISYEFDPGTNFFDGRHHVAITRDASNNIRVFMDGVQKYTINSSSTVTAQLYIGAHSFGYYYLNGKLDNFRVVTDEALWTSNFNTATDMYY